MIRFTGALALCLLACASFAQTASTTVHAVGGGDTLYGIVAQYYPNRMANWTDVAVDIVALNPNAFPEGLDTVMKLGDKLTLVDYGTPLAVPQTASETSVKSATTPDALSPEPLTKPANKQPALEGSLAATVSSAVDNEPNGQTAAAASNVILSIETPPLEERKSGADAPDATSVVIGTVISVTQRALAIDQANQQRSLAANDNIYLGDAITTQRNASVSVRMIDDAQFNVASSSRLMFERYQYDVSTQRGSAIMTLIKGGFSTITGLLGTHHPEAITVNTAVATIGVRGSEFALRVCARETCRAGNDNRALEPGLYTGVVEGSIIVSNNTGDLVTKRGEFYHIAAPNTAPETATQAAAILLNSEQLASLDVTVEKEKPLSFFGWLKRQVLGD